MAEAVSGISRLGSLRSWLHGGDEHSTTRHRDISSGSARAAILGAGDGLVTNVSLILGVAGASAGAAADVRIAGIAGLLAGAFSMAAGELVSMTAQKELAERELEVERHELATEPEAELRELAAMYRAKGISEEDAWTVAKILSSDEDTALDTHAHLELGIDPTGTGAPALAAVSSATSYAVGAILPLFPWFWMEGGPAVLVSCLVAAAAALFLGAMIGARSGRSVLRSALRQLAVAVVAAAVTYGIGQLLHTTGT